CSSHSYSDQATARTAFEKAKQKLFDVNQWSNLKGISSTFELFNERGHRSTLNIPKTGYYIRIILPAPAIENWVRISKIETQENMAEFVVHPSEQPSERAESEPVIEHFFIKEASSTFRVELHGTELIGCEIGRNEGINNQGEEAGDRALANTLIAEGGWAGFQGIQWEKLMAYIVHNEEAANEQ
ncbi:MAG: hypothetical protein LPK19_16980, partial [Hymenobacteraceae bacterium]|nr:hypothetical protein [Hymenobacteraceae bacterium]MDX5397947.1 hypothetical protein [Hymenobacteraceae bacterium]MDX5514019.1 hypothetical protein [Hymenobacteraceae bacterium]